MRRRTHRNHSLASDRSAVYVQEILIKLLGLSIQQRTRFDHMFEEASATRTPSAHRRGAPS
jgi:hypothetical protein